MVFPLILRKQVQNVKQKLQHWRNHYKLPWKRLGFVEMELESRTQSQMVHAWYKGNVQAAWELRFTRNLFFNKRKWLKNVALSLIMKSQNKWFTTWSNFIPQGGRKICHQGTEVVLQSRRMDQLGCIRVSSCAIFEMKQCIKLVLLEKDGYLQQLYQRFEWCILCSKFDSLVMISVNCFKQ